MRIAVMQLGDNLGFAGLILALVGIGVTIMWPTKRWIAYLCFIFAFLLCVCWGVMAYRSSSSDKVEIQRPDFQLQANGEATIAGFRRHNDANGPFMLTVIVLDFQVTNRGEPSSATNWVVHYISPSLDQTIGVARFANGSKITAMGHGKGPDLIVNNSDTITNKTADPIPHGAVVSGKLVFGLTPPDSDADLSRATIIVSCEDYTGKKYATTVKPRNLITQP